MRYSPLRLDSGNYFLLSRRVACSAIPRCRIRAEAISFVGMEMLHISLVSTR